MLPLIDMDRNPNRKRLIDDCSHNRLVDPPCGVGAELQWCSCLRMALLGAVIECSALQPEDSFLKKIHRLKARAVFIIGKHLPVNKPNISLYEIIDSYFISLSHLFQQSLFFLSGEQRHLAKIGKKTLLMAWAIFRKEKLPLFPCHFRPEISSWLYASILNPIGNFLYVSRR